jgi:hypothetical protein
MLHCKVPKFRFSTLCCLKFRKGLKEYLLQLLLWILVSVSDHSDLAKVGLMVSVECSLGLAAR